MIHVVGDIIIDEYWLGEVKRLSPEAPVPIVDLKTKKFSLGGAGNVYMNILSATKDVNLHGYKDQIHNYIFEEIKPQGRLLFTDHMPHKIRVMSDQWLMSRIDSEIPIENNEIEDEFEIENEYDVVVLSDYNKGTVKDPQKIISKAKKVIVDPKKNLELYKGAWCLKPNKIEFEDYIGEELNAKKILVHARRVRDELDVEHFLVTLGSEGVIYVGDTIEHYPATTQKVFDVTGAGDTFTATLAICASLDMPMYKSIIVSNAMAGHAVKTNGTYSLNYNVLDEEMKKVR
jgi:D-beta-D-heptose 7-phosphate kinase/D-beta-D-heptose 1-phosphate adenosyltransferase